MGTLQLLNYAPSAAELAGMWRNIAAYLKPGGSFVGTMENHDVVLAPRLQSGQYGVRETELNELPGGDGFQVHLRFDTQPVVEFDAYRLRKAVFEREAAAAGMVQIEYARPGTREVKQMMAEGVGGEAAQDEDWWAGLLDEAPNLVITARKRE